MRRIATASPELERARGHVPVMLVEEGDQFPNLGSCVGVDTETEQITDTVLAPPLSVLGVYDADHRVCYIVQWPQARWFMRELCSREVQQRYFNLGYDEAVLSNEDDERPLADAIEAGRVVDMQIRIHLREIATIGFIRHNLFSLAGCSLALLNWEMDKGDGSDTSDRMSFKRLGQDGKPYMPTESQAVYLAMDCITTWALGEAVGPQATEIAHTKGMCVLYHITINGFPVDRRVWDYMKDKLERDRDKYLRELVGYGFPDPAAKVESDQDKAYARLVRAVDGFQAASGLGDRLPDGVQFGKNQLRRAVLFMWNHEHSPEENVDCARNVLTALLNPNKGLRKQEQEFWDQLCEDKELIAFDSSRRATTMLMLVALLIEDYTMQLPAANGFDFDRAVENASRQLDDNPSWLQSVPQLGPRKFFVNYVNMLEERTGLKLERTEKSGEPQLTKKDVWRLEDAGIEDGFLTAYTNYGHCVKYLSTYLQDAFVKSDGRVHARYTNLLRTGRTSCANPNILHSEYSRYIDIHTY